MARIAAIEKGFEKTRGRPARIPGTRVLLDVVIAITDRGSRGDRVSFI
jgi:hypothetical protein